MRQIKFRAKNLANEWIYGDLHLNCSKPHLHMDNGMTFSINTETIGQFTGLLDKNGKEIYEGDILLMDCFKTDLGKYTKKMVVSYKIEDANDGTQWSWFTLTDVEDNSECAFLRRKNMTVIGSVHGNPELINS